MLRKIDNLYWRFYFFLVTQEKWPLKAYLFVQKFGVKKHQLEELWIVCAGLCKFSTRLVLWWLLSFSFISIMSTEKEQTMIIIVVSLYLFLVVMYL